MVAEISPLALFGNICCCLHFNFCLIPFKILWRQLVVGLKFFLIWQKFGLDKIWYKKNLDRKKFSPKNALVGKEFWLEKNVGRKKILVGKKFWAEKFLVGKNVGRIKILVGKKFWSEKNFGWKQILVGKKILSEIFFWWF